MPSLPYDNIETRYLREYLSALQIGSSNSAVGQDLTIIPVISETDFALVGTIAEIKALDTSDRTEAYLTARGRAGMFVWRTGNYATRIAADTQGGIYLKADAIASTAGAWVRQFDDDGVNPRWFGAVSDWNVFGRTGTNNAPFFQAAADTAAIYYQVEMGAASGRMRIQPGNYGFSATVYFPGNFKIKGAGTELTKIWRATNYGDTWVFANESFANRVEVSDLEMWHDLPYDRATNANMSNKVTNGAHIRIFGAQGAKFTNIYTFRMTYGIYSVGGTGVELKGCFFYGVWDVDNVANQEGIAQVYVEARAGYSPPTNWDVLETYFAGQASNERNLSWTIGGVPVFRTYNRSIGNIFGLYFEGIEHGNVRNCHFGGLSSAELAFAKRQNAPLLDVEIDGNFFDGSSHGVAILVQPSGASSTFGLNMQITRNTFIDQVHGIEILRAPSAVPSLYGLKITDNVCRNMIGTPIKVGGAVGGQINGNEVTSFNRFNLTQTNADYVCGILINDLSGDIDAFDNKIGGGVYYEDAQASTATYPTPGNTNFCWYDFIIQGGLTQVFNYDTRSNKCTVRVAPNAPTLLR